jgi:hypothetical protein
MPNSGILVHKEKMSQNKYKFYEAKMNTEKNSDNELYKINGIAIATFFGSVLAGGLLMAQNYKQLGKPDEAKKILIYSAIALIIIIALAFVVLDNWNVPAIVFTLPQWVGMQALAQGYQAKDIQAHEEAGGKLASNWKALGISLLVLLAIAAVVFFVAFTFFSVKNPAAGI